MDELEPITPPEEPTGPRLTDRQQAIMKYLENKVPGAGAIYYGVIYAFSQDGNPEYIVQAAHSARELLKRVARAFPGVPADASQGDAYQQLEKLAEFYNANPTDKDLRDKVKDIAEYLKLAEITRRSRYEAFLEKADKGSKPDKTAKGKAAADFLAIEKWLSAVAHHGKSATLDEFRKHLEGFESVFDVLVSGFFGVEKRLDELMVKPAPDDNDLLEINNLTLKSAHLEHFFINLNNLMWFPLLKKAGYFKKPIAEIHHPDGGVSCPSWPQLAFLQKCVTDYPKEVADIILQADSTENSRVHQEFVELAINLPASEAARIIPKAKDWIRDKYKIITLLSARLGELVAKLAREGELTAAYKLAYEITDVHVDEAELERKKKETGIEFTRDAEGHVKDWDYAHMVDQFSELVFNEDPLGLIELFCNRLNKALGMENRSKKPGVYVDYSYIWRPAIEDSDQNTGVDDLKDILIDRISNFSLRYIDDEKANMAQLFELLQKYKYPIFKRIQLFLLSRKPQLDLHLLNSAIADYTLFENTDTYHEYYILINNNFDLSPPESQLAYLRWVKRGPDREQLMQLCKTENGQAVSNEQLECIIADWQHRRLSPIREFLEGTWKEFYNGLSSKIEKPKHPEFVSYHTSWVGPTSPLSEAQISKMSILEVIDFIKTWRPSEGPFAPSPEGLGRFLSEDVKTRFNEYLNNKDDLTATIIRPVYFYHIFMGLEQAVKSGITLDWNNAISLAESIVIVNNLPEPDRISDDFETGWEGVKKEIASFINKGLESTDRIPYQFGERIWKLIEKLIQEPDPTVEFETEYGGDNMSPVDMSINTGRGEASHALFKYAYWYDENDNKGIGKENQRHQFPPEALKIVDSLLDPQKEPTLTIRSVIGQYFQYLVYLDVAWTKANLARIIPEIPEYKNLRDAVFEGYFSMNHPNGYTFKNLRGFYEAAFEWAAYTDDTSTMHQPRRHYFDHLMTFYWQGLEPIEKESSLIRKLFADGKPNTKAHVLEYVGRSLEGLLPSLPGALEALKRIRDLLEWRIAELKLPNVDTADVKEELQPFGWWFAKSHIDKAWLIGRLNEILTMTNGVIDWANGVLERLPEFIQDYPIEVAQAVDSIVKGAKNLWDIDFWKDRLLFRGKRP
jgi:hypothetical protein